MVFISVFLCSSLSVFLSRWLPASASVSSPRAAEDETRRLEQTWHALTTTFVWGSLWGSLTTKRAVFSVLKRKTQANEKEPKALD